MKILVSAIACNPITGSESAVGWSGILALAKRHELWVLLHPRNRAFFETWSETHTLPSNIHLCYVGELQPWHPNRMIARIQSWTTNSSWQQHALEAAKKLHAEIGFDLVHHLTYATWRTATPLGQLGIPLFWGPLGGAEWFPWRLATVLSPTALAFEVIRAISNFISSWQPAIRSCTRQAAACIGSNRDTSLHLSKLRGNTDGIEMLNSCCFPMEKIESFRELLPKKTHGGPLRLFSGGNLEGKKGVAIGFHGLAEAQRNGVSFSYFIGGSGPERKHLERLAADLGINLGITFSNGLSGSDYQNALIETHIYLLPSLRENNGVTLMEAMLAGCVPIVADCGGPSDIVTDECGFRIKITNARQMAAEIAQIIVRLNQDRALLARMGAAAHEQIVARYSSRSYEETINHIYAKALVSKQTAAAHR